MKEGKKGQCYCFCLDDTPTSLWCMANHRYCKTYKERKWEEYQKWMKTMK